MAAPKTGQTKRKFSNEQLAQVFTGDYRQELGKIELSAQEITDILNEHILEDSTVTRQAVNNRLKNLVGKDFDPLEGRLVRKTHGRSFMYYRDTDLERVFADGGQVDGAIPITTQNKFLIATLFASAGIAAYYGGYGVAAFAALGGLIGIIVFIWERRNGINRLWRLGEFVAGDYDRVNEQ
jgi:hypothetical protein